MTQPTSQMKLAEIAGTIRVKEVTSSFAMEARNAGIAASSFVSYTVHPSPEHPDGWTMEEARIVEAMVAQRVSKDLYADLAARNLVTVPDIKAKQLQVTQQYDRLLTKLGSKAITTSLPSSSEEISRKEPT